MSDPTVRELLNARVEMEREIQNRVATFERKYGVTVTALDLDHRATMHGTSEVVDVRAVVLINGSARSSLRRLS